MIKANETRIGNWVRYGKRLFRIDTIAPEFPTLNTQEFGIGVVDWNNIHPVHLTEKWLFCFGFSEMEERTYELSDFKDGVDLVVKLYKEKTIVTLWSDDPVHFANPPMKVHQLQNFYFALTGEELEINLND